MSRYVPMKSIGLRGLSYIGHMIAVLTWVHAAISAGRTTGKLAVRVVASLRPTHTYTLENPLFTGNIYFIRTNYKD